MSRYKKGIAVSVAVLLVLGLVRILYPMGTGVPVMAEKSSMPTVIIDPGHGGVDGGAVGIDGIVEKGINLSICLTMRDFFAVSGFDVVMTRETDVSIHDDGITNIHKQKTSDLYNRLAVIQAHPNAVFLCMHQNKFGNSQAHGAQVFYGPKNEQSRQLAQVIQENFVEDLQPDNDRAVKESGKNLFLLYYAECPSVLVECGFLSNREEAHRLADAGYQSQIAFTTYRSVLEFFGLDVSSSVLQEQAMSAIA